MLNLGQGVTAWAGGLLTLERDQSDYDKVMSDAAALGNALLFPLPNYKGSGKKSLSLYE